MPALSLWADVYADAIFYAEAVVAYHRPSDIFFYVWEHFQAPEWVCKILREDLKNYPKQRGGPKDPSSQFNFMWMQINELFFANDGFIHTGDLGTM